MSLKTTTSRALGIGGLVVAAVLFFAVNVLSEQSLTARRVDLTENNLYTLSDGTRSILSKLGEPITIRFYYSRKLATGIPSIKSYADRVRELLREYERAAGGMLTVVEIEPEPFSEEEDRAVAYGLRGVPLEAGDVTLYFGLVGSGSTDQEEVIPYLSGGRETFLEYDLTKLVHNLGTSAKQHTVGVLSTLPIDGMGPQAALRGLNAPPWVVMEQIRQLFEVVTVARDATAIPPEVDVLMVVHPKELPDPTLYAIDQFVLSGGKALVFVDPNAEGEQPNMAGNMPMPVLDRSSDLGGLLGAWGVELEKEVIAADLALAVAVSMEQQGRLLRFDYPAWINLPPELFDADDVITAQLGNVAFATPGALAVDDATGLTVTPLMRTTPGAMRMPASKVALGADPQELLDDYEPGAQALTLAARVQGKAKTAFPDGSPTPESGTGSESASEGGAGEAADANSQDETVTDPPDDAQAHKAEGDINVIVVADTDMLMDRFWVQVQDFLGSRLAVPTAANGSFVINALDNLTGSSELISVRNRGSFTRPFTRIEGMRREAEMAFRQKERELTQRLEETERKLVELEQAKQGEEALVLSAAQQRELLSFRDERLQIRGDLRNVRRELRKNIESLENRLKFANIGLVPVLIAIVGLVAGLWQMRRHQARATHA